MCDFFKDDDFVEVNAKWLQDKIINFTQNERLMSEQLREYKRQVDVLQIKVDSLKAEQIQKIIESDVRYRLNERV